jgi:hypothetical protein
MLYMWVFSLTARGASEGASLTSTGLMEDLASLAKNKSFVLSTIAFTCVTFSAGEKENETLFAPKA